MERRLHIKDRLLTALAIIVVTVIIGCDNNQERFFWSPYQDLNWHEIGHYDSEFHTHPGLGDEQYDPHETIDRYHEEGYQILTLAGHDYNIPDYHGTIYTQPFYLKKKN